MNSVADTKRRYGRHSAHTEHTVTVSDLLKRAIAAGDPIRLAWSEEDIEPGTGLVRPYPQDSYPTGVLPTITKP